MCSITWTPKTKSKRSGRASCSMSSTASLAEGIRVRAMLNASGRPRRRSIVAPRPHECFEIVTVSTAEPENRAIFQPLKHREDLLSYPTVHRAEPLKIAPCGSTRAYRMMLDVIPVR